MELTAKISNYYENLRRKNTDIHEKRVEEINKTIPEIREIDGLIRDIALRAAIEQIKDPNQDKSFEESEKIYKLKLKKMDFLEKKAILEIILKKYILARIVMTQELMRITKNVTA
ncbi:P-loop NTPase family protein [Peptoniphilus senegalensis]|uniref:hypothetical protein n=1 Tax=Peptoniphilus senegalensis TaxID=1465757 RepID=UPI0002E8BD49|nr:hypothetical protein [Peptoniphilus senegalensis]